MIQVVLGLYAAAFFLTKEMLYNGVGCGKVCGDGGIVLESGGVIEELSEDGMYKYLGIEELDGFKHEQMKEKAMKAAKGKLRKLLESELNSKNVIMYLIYELPLT